MALSVSVPRLVKFPPQVEMDWADEGSVPSEHNPAQETKVSYHNNLDVPLWVSERSGAVQLLSPRQGPQRVFAIRISRRFHTSTTVTYDLSEMTENKIGALRPDVSMRAMAESYNPVFSSMVGMGTTKDVVFTVTRRKLEEHGGSIYHEASDLVISLTRESAFHQGSPQARLAAMRMELADQCGLKFVGHPRVSVAIIDNERVYGDKYINLGGIVHLAKAIQSDKFPSGVYVSRDGIVNEAGNASNPTVERYKFEEVSDSVIKLYDSREAARTRGDPEKAAEELTAQIKSETVVLKNVLEKETLENKLSATREQSEQEEKSLKRKDYYEDRSHRRKDDSDETKYIFAAIAGLFGVLALFLK